MNQPIKEISRTVTPAEIAAAKQNDDYSLSARMRESAAASGTEPYRGDVDPAYDVPIAEGDNNFWKGPEWSDTELREIAVSSPFRNMDLVPGTP